MFKFEYKMYGDDYSKTRNSSNRSNFFKFGKKILKNHSRVIRPSSSLIKEYAEFLRGQWQESLKAQFNGRNRRVYRGIKSGGDGKKTTYGKPGIASGALRNSIKGVVNVTVRHAKSNGKVDIDYRLSSEYNVGANGFRYGDYISYGRKAASINIGELIKWLKVKKVKVYQPIKRNARGEAVQSKISTEKLRIRAAILISNAAKKNRKPPVIKDWQRIDRNERLAMEFERRTKKASRRIRNRMRYDIMKNIRNK